MTNRNDNRLANRIVVGLKDGMLDARGDRVRREIKEHLGICLDTVRTIDIYTVDAQLSSDELEAAASGPFSDPVIQEYKINQPLAKEFDLLVEVGFRPGVTDNAGRTASEAIQYITGRNFTADEAVYTSVQYLLCGDIDKEIAEQIASGFLANGLIQRWTVIDKNEFVALNGLPAQPAVVVTTGVPQIREIDLAVSDAELMNISRDGMLALNLEEMHKIQQFIADPQVQQQRAAAGGPAQLTDAELEALAQTWSEHCKHKIFSAKIEYQDENGECETIDSLFKTYIVGATSDIRAAKGDKDFCLSVFKDNAGVIEFTDEWSMVYKVETHNSPSALDPYGGALTGIVGVNRDPFGTGRGARLIFNTDVFCFASPFYDKPLPPRLLHPRRIFDGVVTGVEHGGNKSGIPTVNGSLVFDDRFAGKPLVYCGSAALMPAQLHGRPGHEKKANVGDHIVMVGGRVGKDGIHGATFSSEELNEDSPVTAVQIGDPITQRRMFDFLLITRDRGLYSAITDNGAGGLSSSVGEMAEDTGGFEMHLDRIPLKYSGLQPWEILISEAQERMTVAVPPKDLAAFMQLSAAMDVESTDLGTFTDSGYYHCLYEGKTATYLPMQFLHEGAPQMQLTAKWQQKQYSEPAAAVLPAVDDALEMLLGSLNVCSKECVVRRYDHEVQGATVQKPLTGVDNDGPADGAVVRPLFDSFAGITTAHGICPRYSDIDTYHMMACAIDEALRNYVSVGGNIDHVAGLDNFCWCDPVQSDRTPDGEYKAAQLVRANKALYEYCVAFGVPLISGKDSMKNDYQIGDTKISIPPTVLFSVIGRVEDVRLSVSMDVKHAGDKVYLLGVTKAELGASELYTQLGFVGNSVPTVDASTALRRYRTVNKAQQAGLIASCHDLSDGGLGVAAAETAFAGGFGVEIDLGKVNCRGTLTDLEILYSESQSRLLITVEPEKSAEFEKLFSGQDLALIGTVTAKTSLQVVGLAGSVIIDRQNSILKEAWQAPLREL